MADRKSIIVLFLLCISLTGCSEKQSSASEEGTVILETPSYTVMQEETERSFEGMDIVDGYWVKKIENSGASYTLAVPVLKKKMADVYDLEDMMAERMDGSDRVRKAIGKLNTPQGASYNEKENQIISAGYISVPKSILEQPQEEFSQQMISAAWSSSKKKNNEGESEQNIINEADADCIMFSLYEDFYEEIPVLNVKLYGVTEEIYAQNLLSEKDEQSGEGKKSIEYRLYSEHQEGLVSLDLLVDTNIEKSGKYYIDYRDLQRTTKYKQMIYVFTFDRKPETYSFCINNAQYQIQDENQYALWKEKNSGLYLSR